MSTIDPTCTDVPDLSVLLSDPTASVDITQGHPRPHLRRHSWVSLDGLWDYAADDERVGVPRGWPARGVHERTIRVPFPPESSLSGIGDTDFHPVVWYSRRIAGATVAQLRREAGPGGRILLHVGALDYRAQVWANGAFVGSHEGGHVSFTCDLTDNIAGGTSGHDDAGGSPTNDLLLVIRAEDEPVDAGQPRGKQDWQREPHSIWYARTTGIWQSVWLEAVPATYVTNLCWTPSRECDAVTLDVEFNALVPEGTRLCAQLRVADRLLAEASMRLGPVGVASMHIDLRDMVHGQQYEQFLWSPEHPQLIDAVVTLDAPTGALSADDANEGTTRDAAEAPRTVRDEIASYLGLRSVGTQAGRFILNDRPYYVRSVLEQGFWPESHLAAPSDEALRDEVALIKALGFNATRIHQKVENPRLLYWADRLGLLVWGEMAAPYEFTSQSLTRLTREWLDVVRRDRSHPCIVTWVPVNESWGVQHVGYRSEQQALTRALADLTRALDPSRPVVSNDGWEHTCSDILTIHDYDPDNARVRARYASTGAVRALIEGCGPSGRMTLACGHQADPAAPVMVSEFGGIRYVPQADASSWGYTTATDAADFEARLREVFEAVHASPVLAGFCYTQLTDTMQEANGVVDAQRRPKLDAAVIREIVIGTHPTA